MPTHALDLAVILSYLLGITAVGVWVSRRARVSSSSYFLAGRSLRWPTIGLALFATNISAVHLVGLASDGFQQGLVVGNFEWMAVFCLVLLGLVFAPFYFRSRVATLPEFLERRFGPGARSFLAFMAVVGALFVHIGVALYAGAVVLESFAGIPVLASILAVSALTVLYTVSGGLKAVVVTESIQTVVLLLGALAVTGFGLAALAAEGITSLAALREAAGAEQLSMVRPDGPYAWKGILLGYPVLGIWYWCSDQTIVQRVLGARSERDAQLGPLFAGALKVLPVFLMVMPGIFAGVLFRDQIGDAPDQTLVVLIQELLPAGLRGLVVAGLLAALMSTVAGALNSTATLVSFDILQRLRPDSSERTLVRTGQATAVGVMIAAILWSTQGERFGGIFQGINAMIAVLAPPISAVFLWGVFWRRGTSAAAMTTLVTGFLLGAVAFVLDFPVFGYQILTERWGVPFLMQAWWLFVICSLVFAGVSLVTPPPPPEVAERYCWGSPLRSLTESRWSGLLDPRLLSLLLVAAMILLYLSFA